MRKGLITLLALGTLGLGSCKDNTQPPLKVSRSLGSDAKEIIYGVYPYPGTTAGCLFVDKEEGTGLGTLDYASFLTPEDYYVKLISRSNVVDKAHPLFPKYEVKFEEIKEAERQSNYAHQFTIPNFN